MRQLLDELVQVLLTQQNVSFEIVPWRLKALLDARNDLIKELLRHDLVRLEELGWEEDKGHN